MVELIPKKKKRPPFGKLFFIMVSLLLFAGIVIGFFILRTKQSDTREILNSLTTRLEQLTAPQQEEIEKELLLAQKKISDFVLILEERTDYLAVFELVESTTHPEVVLVSFAASMDSEEILLAGQAPSFRILEQQRLVWENEENIGNVTLESITLGDEKGGTDFRVELLASPDLVLPYASEEIDIEE